MMPIHAQNNTHGFCANMWRANKKVRMASLPAHC
jgi:hypothetical protein